MAPFTALLTLGLQAPLGIQKLRHATERLVGRRPPSAVKPENVQALLPGKTSQPQRRFFRETSSMAPFTALLTLGLQTPLGIQKLRHATERLAGRRPPLAVKPENDWALLPGKTSQPQMAVLS